jgi:hypothetical protein
MSRASPLGWAACFVRGKRGAHEQRNSFPKPAPEMTPTIAARPGPALLEGADRRSDAEESIRQHLDDGSGERASAP